MREEPLHFNELRDRARKQAEEEVKRLYPYWSNKRVRETKRLTEKYYKQYTQP